MVWFDATDKAAQSEAILTGESIKGTGLTSTVPGARIRRRLVEGRKRHLVNRSAVWNPLYMALVERGPVIQRHTGQDCILGRCAQIP